MQDEPLNPTQSDSERDITSDELSFVHDAVLLEETVAAVLGVKSLPKPNDINLRDSRL